MLTERERMEIRDAAAYLVDESTNVRREEITRKSFSFSGNFSGKLEKVRSDLLKGRGFALIRGVPLEFLSTEEERAAAALCLGSYFGKLLPQNGKGHVLGHVKDIGLDANNPNHRIYATSAAQPFHTDSADIVGLLCINKAMEGGLSSFCSSTRIFRQILKERPDLADVLTRPFHVDRKGEIPKGKLPYYELAIFHLTLEGRVVCILDRSFISAAQRWPQVPRLTRLQTEALDLVEAKAASDELRFDMMLEPGDLQLVHNHVILHARSAFKDYVGGDKGKQRHLLRLWMCPQDGIAIPATFAERYGSNEVGNRGGMPCERLVAPLDAC